MDVETILKEIRNRVVSDVRANEANAGTEATSNGSLPQTNQSESLTRVSAHLAVTGRAWDRLPPVFSNRHGTSARLELWLKRKSKSLTRWFTWEQVNFNRAVKDALSDVIEILEAEARELAMLRGQLTQEMHRQFTSVRAGADDQARELREMEARLQQADAALAHVTQIVTSLTDEREGRFSNLEREHANLAREHANLELEHSKLANQVIDLTGQLRAEDQQIKSQQDEEINRRLSALAAELKEEQRVCFRQVSLEANESAVLEDRARRALLARLEELEESVKDLSRG
jgi:chromosome segregation ATPase